jgi:hypothetical protein
MSSSSNERSNISRSDMGVIPKSPYVLMILRVLSSVVMEYDLFRISRIISVVIFSEILLIFFIISGSLVEQISLSLEVAGFFLIMSLVSHLLISIGSGGYEYGLQDFFIRQYASGVYHLRSNDNRTSLSSLGYFTVAIRLLSEMTGANEYSIFSLYHQK